MRIVLMVITLALQPAIRMIPRFVLRRTITIVRHRNSMGT